MARHLSHLEWEKWFEKFKEFKKREKDDVDKSFTYKILKIPKSTFYFWLKKKKKHHIKILLKTKLLKFFMN